MKVISSCWPLIGSYEVIQAKFLHEIFVKYSKKYGPVFTVSVGPYHMVVLNDINSVTEALVKSKSDFADRPLVHSAHMLTEGSKDIIFAKYTPTWKLHRKISVKALRQYLAGNRLEEVLHASMNICLPLMAKENGAFNPENYIDLMVFNILNAVCFGESVELDDPEFMRFMKLSKKINEMTGNGFVEDMFPIMCKIWTTHKYRTIHNMNNELISIIKRKFEEHEETFNIDNVRDFTDSLILARKEAEQEEKAEILSQLSDTHLRQTVFNIFSAGIETSTVTLGFAVRYMAGLPEIQSKVQEEIDRVVGKDRLPTVKDRENLSYTEATLHEVMRLGTAVPLGIPHSTICDTRVGGYDVPKDTMVMINHWALHNDPNYWKDVKKFDPTRYLDENGKLGMKPESWLPFSAGRRGCLGESVAKPELHLIFATLMQKFKITLPEGTNPEIELCGSGAIAIPAPYKVIVKERNLL
ncbi:steroid 17-alpha-hydroxylase/17,20 lyase-like isoform X2 [Mytilus californianus]|uniref:steroid 17-alpha-hydroxylase/17,20 lyase-like isoform X2 n=1 Tax=Mytilus californianus TaxID=6549 RepID=UPI002246F5C5|nr:steroid 17-alpha-hydroxylase/17,20 lyase-like isoform X2 [Mytilus californianus]